MKLHYLEVVAADVEAICAAYEAVHSVTFAEADASLGGARVANLADGSSIGVRAPLRDSEAPIVRPYWLVDDIDKAVTLVEAQGAEIAVPPLEIADKGKFAIYIHGAINHGFWQL